MMPEINKNTNRRRWDKTAHIPFPSMCCKMLQLFHNLKDRNIFVYEENEIIYLC